MRNKRILVTGACGTVGYNLTLSLLKKGATVCLFDSNEKEMFKLDQRLKSISSQYKCFIGDIRDSKRLIKAFNGVTGVFHCAGLKHVYLSEYNPFEAVKTNIIGTHNVIEAALSCDVEKVVFTSSDKAVNPVSTMGATKLLSERLFIQANQSSGKSRTRFACIRFGNIINSSGSMIRLFRDQYLSEKEITLTSNEMTRFIIDINTSIELCLFAYENSIGGEIISRNMGSCYVKDIIKIINSDSKCKVTTIGPKPGEKLFEELVTESEVNRTKILKKYFITIPETLDYFPQELKESYKIYSNLPNLESPVSSISVSLDIDSLKSIIETSII
jgi:FlaA1/EpsC-like NDP-sugar epimerase